MESMIAGRAHDEQAKQDQEHIRRVPSRKGCVTMPLSLQARALIFGLRGYRLWQQRQSPDLAAQRAAQDTFGDRLPKAAHVRVVPLVVAGRPAEWAIPTQAPAQEAVLFLHGGAYIAGSLRSHRAMVTRIAAASGRRVLSLDYRLAPEHPYPAALDDAIAAYQWLLAQDIAPEHLAIVGDSAGGGLSMATLVALRDRALPLPAAAALFSPWIDLSDATATWERHAKSDLVLTPASLHEGARAYGGDIHLQFPLISPTYALLHGLPPLMVHVGGEELLVDDIAAFVAKAKTAGVAVDDTLWPGLFHDFVMMAASFPEGQRAIEQVGAFLHHHLGRSTTST